MKEHFEKFHADSFICVVCDYEDTSDVALREHMTSEHGMPSKQSKL